MAQFDPSYPKYKKNIPSDLKRRINRLAALFELADEEFNNIKIDTEKFEEQAKTIADKPNQQLSIFSFLNVVSPAFPTYQFINYKADGFVYEILKIDNTFTQEELKKAINNYIDIVKRFNSEIVFQTPAHYLNPYTMVRHCLYLLNKEKFDSILFDIQKQSFEEWLSKNRIEK